jgi:hypothetical protein
MTEWPKVMWRFREPDSDWFIATSWGKRHLPDSPDVERVEVVPSGPVREALEAIVDEFTNGATANMEFVRQTAERALSELDEPEVSDGPFG